MRLKFALPILVLLPQPALAQSAAAGVLTGEEIASAYRSTGPSAGLGPLRTGRRHAQEVRGWRLKFRRLSESAGPIATTRKYRAMATKDRWCAEYLVTDMVPMGNPRIKPVLVAEPLGPVKACR